MILIQIVWKKNIPSPFASSSARIRSWSVRGLLKEITAPQSFFFFFSFFLTKQETGCFRCCCFSVFFVPILMMPFFVFSLFRKNWIWLHPTGRQCWLYRRKRNGKFTATGKRWDPERTLGKRRGGGRRRKTTMTPSSCYERRLSGVIVVVLPVYFLFEPYFFTPWPSPENSTQFCLAAFDVPVASPPPHFTIYFYPVKSEQKRKERESKNKKKTSFSICLPKNVFSIVFIVGKHFKSRCQQRSCVVFYFLLWHWLSFFFSLALLAIVLWPAKMDSLPRSKRKSEWWHASGSFFYFKNEKKILLISKKLLLFCHLKTTWKMCFCVFNLFWLIHKFFLYL